MKTITVFSIVLLVTAVVSLLCIWFYPSIQDFMAGNTMWNGIKNFIEEFDAENIDSTETIPDLPEKSVLISIPYLEYTDEDLAEIQEYVGGGGTLLLMDDYGFGNEILTYLGLGIRFSNKPLLDPLICYKNQWMPKITDFPKEITDESVEVVILNHATAILYTEGVEVLAYSSEASYLDINENETRDADEPADAFPVAARINAGKGTIILVSDPSVLISSMIERDDNHLFIKYLLHLHDEPEEILVDRSHLSKTPLDVSKIRLAGTREFISSPYTLVGVLALIFVVISRYTFRKGEAVG